MSESIAARVFLKVAAIFLVFGYGCECSRILAVFPTPSISHQVVFRKLTIELSKRGHELVIFTSDPLNDPTLKNYTEIDMHHTYKYIPNFVEVSGSFQTMWRGLIEDLGGKNMEALLSTPEMQEIIATGSKKPQFDLIIVECLFYDAIYALMSHLNTPLIAMASLPLVAHIPYAIGNPPGLAYSPGVFDAATDDMDFWGRLENAWSALNMHLLYRWDTYPQQTGLLNKYFGPNMPSIDELARNVSLILVNEHPVLAYPRPNLPNIIQVGGIALNRNMKGLEPGLKKFLDGAKKGFIYFSLGSNVKSKQLPAQKIEALMGAFAELPYKVLWKWELDVLPGKPENVFTHKWLPQYDVLAHPNIKLFISQGGLQSTEEAVSLGVPMVGIPVFADQEFNVRKIASLGVAKRVDFMTFDKNEIKNAILEVIEDEGYKKRMLDVRNLFLDEQNTPLERAVWWTEYVIRNKGVPHLRTRVRNLSWYEREHLDMLAFVLALMLAGCLAAYALIRCLMRFLFNQPKTLNDTKIKNN